MRSKALVAVAVVALVGSGLVAGSVIGGESTNTIAEELGRDFGEPVVQRATPEGAQAAIRAGAGKKRKKARKPKKPKVIHGAGRPIPVGPGESSVVALRCPRRFPVPMSAGLATVDPAAPDQAPHVFPDYIGRYFEIRRAMLVAVVNTGGQGAEWTPTIVCMKGAKEV